MATAALACAVGPVHAGGKLSVDLELVLAVDASGSVDAAEYRLQMAGIAATFRDADVLAAVAEGAHGRIAVALVTWAEAGEPKDASPWHVVGDAASAERFARLAEGFPRRVVGGTGVGMAVAFCARLFEGNGISGNRRVIDLSGDGAETTPRDFFVVVDQARAMALKRGITVNGLAILTDEPDLEAYYRSQLIVGPDAFTMAAATYEDFAAAMRRKLIREVRYRPKVSGLSPALTGHGRR